jgi:hypothetical protein
LLSSKLIGRLETIPIRRNRGIDKANPGTGPGILETQGFATHHLGVVVVLIGLGSATCPRALPPFPLSGIVVLVVVHKNKNE